MTETLKQQLLHDHDVRRDLIVALARLADTEVSRARGVGGATLRSGFAALKRLRPSIIERGVESLIDDWIDRLEPHYRRHVLSATYATFGAYIAAHADAVAEDLLEVTDRRAQRTSHRMARAFFRRLRRNAQTNLVDAVPRLGEVMDGLLYSV